MVPQIQIQNSGGELGFLLGSIMSSLGNDYHRKAGNQILTGFTEALYCKGKQGADEHVTHSI